MRIGALLLPKKSQGAQLTLPFWDQTAALVVGMAYCLDCDYEEQTPLEQRQRWIVYVSGELLYMTPFLLEMAYECG